MYKALIIFAGAVLVLHGCSGASVKSQNSANVTSSPSSAEVYANGKKLGVTPLSQDLYDVFPAGWKNSVYQAQGELIIKKDGCKDFTLEVGDYILSQPIHADLVCDASYQADKPVQIPSSPNGTEERLKELKSLYDKGLISKDEFSVTRKRILDEL